MQNNMTNRDSTLDCMRAMIMLYIVLVIHGIHNFHYLPTRSHLFSLMLFEMPIVFFISGVSCMLSSRKTVLQTIESRLKRVLIPYYIWAFFALVSIVVTHSFSWQGFWLVLSCNNIVNIPYVTQMWFIWPYILVFVLGSILIQIYDYCQERQLRHFFLGVFIILISLAIVTLDYLKEIWSVELLRNVLVYGLFFIFGFVYRINNRRAALLALIGLIGWGTLIKFGGYPFATQDNKFPPNLCFIFWGISSIGFLSLFMNNCKISNNFIFDTWGKYGFDIYLYQNFAYWPVAKLVYPHLFSFPVFFQYVTTTFLAFAILTILAKPIHNINSIVVNFCSSKLLQNSKDKKK